ncbi:MAG: hypothetical protein HYY21_07465 [Candidatus Tectomicrobia bacterium]|nr:hypothetical protein [Candidatus Tectomicrobia bacterium]
MSIVALQVQAILRNFDRKLSSPRDAREDERKPSASAPRDEVTISLEAKRRHLMDQIAGRVVREIAAQAIRDPRGEEEATRDGRAGG